MLSNIEKLLKTKNIFEREHKNMKTRALEVILYHFSISMRNTGLVVSSFGHISHETLRNWYLRAVKIFQIKKDKRKIITIDETKIKISGKLYITWTAVDIENWMPLDYGSSKDEHLSKPIDSFKMFDEDGYCIHRCLPDWVLNVNTSSLIFVIN